MKDVDFIPIKYRMQGGIHMTGFLSQRIKTLQKI